MNEREKSDSPVVPAKPPNKSGAAVTDAEVVEERGLAKGNTDSTARTARHGQHGTDRNWLAATQRPVAFALLERGGYCWPLPRRGSSAPVLATLG
jgi:hypothetical protein